MSAYTETMSQYTWIVMVMFLLLGAIFLFFGMLLASVHGHLDGRKFTFLSFTGIASVAAQAVLMWNIQFHNDRFSGMFGLILILGVLAGALTIRRLRNNRITDSTASYLLLVGHVVYPTFLLVFLLWSWDITP